MASEALMVLPPTSAPLSKEMASMAAASVSKFMKAKPLPCPVSRSLMTSTRDGAMPISTAASLSSCSVVLKERLPKKIRIFSMSLF
jgi:hypothetical protein